MFHERLRAELERAARYKRELSLIVFDLDDFKQLNDVHGHQEGDTVLGMVADVAARGAPHRHRRGVPDRRRGVRDPAAGDGQAGGRARGRPLCPAGARDARGAADDRLLRRRDVPRGRHDPTELYTAADAALYAAKEWGKDRDRQLLGARCRCTPVAGLREQPAPRARVAEPAEAAGGAGRQAQPAERRQPDRDDDRIRAADDDRLPQRARLPARRGTHPGARCLRWHAEPQRVRGTDARRAALRDGGGDHRHGGAARPDAEHRRRAGLRVRRGRRGDGRHRGVDRSPCRCASSAARSA